MRKRLGVVILAILVIAAALLAIFRHGAARFAVYAIARASGYSLQMGDMRLGGSHGAMIDVHVSRNGEPVLDAQRIDVYYNLRDLLPGSRHRFGLVALSIDRPRITIVHHENGTYNVVLPTGAAAPAPPRPGPVVPLDVKIRVRDGQARLIDQYRYYKESRYLSLANIDADVAIDTAARTHYVVTGALEDTGPQPFRAAGTVDYAKGYALHHVSLTAIPIKAIGNYFINSPAARILGGTVRNMDLQMYAFDLKPNEPVAYHMIGSGTMADGQMQVASLDAPIRHINGGIDVFDGGFAARSLRASVGHIPIRFAGGIFNFARPQFRLGVEGRADLTNLKEVAHFAAKLPIRGGVRIHALIEGDISAPILLIGFDGKRFYYQAVPIDDPRGTVALYKSNLIVLPFHAMYDGIAMRVEGNLALGKSIRSTLVLHALGPSARIPYLGALIENQPIATEALLNGTDLKVDARGYIASTTDPAGINGFYAINRNGTGAFGPISLRTKQGGELVASFDLDRPHGNSAFWVSVHDVRLHQPEPIRFPGVTIPQLPPIDAHIVEANIAGTGSARNTVIGGSAYMKNATIAGVPFYSIAARFAGPFAAAQLSTVHADGPWGTFDGGGSFAPSAIVARGNYSGTLQGLRPFIGNFPAQGGINGPMGIAIAQGKIYVQAQNAALSNATIHGIPISAISGSMAFDNGVLRVYSAQAKAAGGTVVAAGSFATGPHGPPTRMALATTQLDAGALHGFGVPIASGTLRAVGAVGPGGAIPNVDAGVVLRGGRAAGYGPFDASAEVAIAGDAVRIRDGVAALGSTYANLDGRIGGLAAGVPQYDLAASVPVGRISSVADLMKLPTYKADGSFDGNVRIGGAGTNPNVRGTVGVPVGEINGLGFRMATASISASRAGVAVRHGSVQVGSTNATFSASVAPNSIAFAMRAPRADLSDFNDYFDTGDTLSGKGSVALDFSHLDGLIYTDGDVDVLGLRYRRLPIGDTLARWTSLRNNVRAAVTVGGEHGKLTAHGTVAFARSQSMQQLVAHSRYDVVASLRDLDLTTWLPAFGFPQVPVTGRVDGDATIVGTYPHIGISGTASIDRGTIGPLPIERAQVALRSSGDRIDVTRLVFSLPALDATGTGSFGLAANAPMKFDLHAVTTDLPRLVARATKKHFDVSGRIESTLSIGGTFKAPTFNAGVEGTNIVTYGIRIPSFVGQIALRGKSLVVRNAEVAFDKGTATIAGSLPLQLQPFAFGPPAAPISMDFIASGVDLATFAPLMGNDTKLGGTLDGHVGISGTVRNPRIYGRLGATDGTYVSALETIPITHTVAQITFEGTHATLDKLHAQLGNGVLDGDGSLNFGGGLNGGPLGYALAMRTHGAQLSLPTYGSGTFDSTLSLNRSPGALAQLGGHVTVSDAVIPFFTFLNFGGGNGKPGGGLPFNLGFDLRITAGRNVAVRGGGVGIFGLNIPAAGTALLAGTLAHPTLDGVFNATGGTLTYIDHAFRVQTGSVTFMPSNGVIPNVYAVATTHVTNPDPNPQRNPTGSTDITVTVSGPVTSPKMTYESSPTGYSQQQIIALLLPLGGLVGPIQFTDTGVILPPGQLNGAPAAGTGAILPDVLVRRQNGTLTVGQEAFNILNAQFASGLLAPIENALGSTLGVSDVNLTLDYTGAFGINFRRLLSHNFYALYGTTFGVPVRQTFGFSYQPNAFTSAQFTMFVQSGNVPLFLSPNQTLSTNARAAAGQAVLGQSGFTFLYQRLF